MNTLIETYRTCKKKVDEVQQLIDNGLTDEDQLIEEFNFPTRILDLTRAEMEIISKFEDRAVKEDPVLKNAFNNLNRREYREALVEIAIDIFFKED